MSDRLKEEYKEILTANIRYFGYSFKTNTFKKYLLNRIKPKFDDKVWSDDLINEAVETTGFSSQNFIEIFKNREEITEWRIGELLAECILEDERNVRFYYNSSRDSKNLKSNLTGADLVGFCNIDDDVCFLFGEVKTSSDENTPPQVLYGKSGMVKQLESLKDDVSKRMDLVKWIAGKSKSENSNFKDDYGKALKTYIQSNQNKVGLVGVLVRDTKPSENDLKSRAKALNKNINNNMQIELLAIYTGLKMSKNNWQNVMNRGVKSEN